MFVFPLKRLRMTESSGALPLAVTRERARAVVGAGGEEAS